MNPLVKRLLPGVISRLSSGVGLMAVLGTRWVIDRTTLYPVSSLNLPVGARVLS